MKKRVLKSAGSLVLIIALVLSMGIGTFALTYRDVPGHWGEKYIQKWTNEEVVNGYPDGNFKPDANITRAEAAAVICRFLELDTDDISISNPYKDVSASEWYYKNVLACYEAGVMIGNQDGTFTPTNNITRQEAITTIGRAVNLKIGDTGIEEFDDGGYVAVYAEGYVNAMIRDGYVNGYPDNTLKPTNSITRAEFVKILYYVNAPISETNPNTPYILYTKIDDNKGGTVTAHTSYLTANDSVAYEYVTLIDQNYENYRAAFPSSYAKQVLDEGLAAFNNGDSAWAAYVAKYYNGVEETQYRSSFIDVISSRNAKLGDLVAGIQYQMTFDDMQQNRLDVVYTVTVWIERS